jgi:hypothetical protein
MSEPQSLKEYWSDAKHNRRHSPGRREADYAVCLFHDGHIEQSEKDKHYVCEKINTTRAEHIENIKDIYVRINQLEGRIVGKWTFGIMITVLLGMFAITSTINMNINTEIRSEVKAIRADLDQQKR